MPEPIPFPRESVHFWLTPQDQQALRELSAQIDWSAPGVLVRVLRAALHVYVAVHKAGLTNDSSYRLSQALEVLAFLLQVEPGAEMPHIVSFNVAGLDALKRVLNNLIAAPGLFPNLDLGHLLAGYGPEEAPHE